MREANRFQFSHGVRLRGVTVLNATMADFSYADHAHAELALGVTLSGIQEFRCRGRSYRSPPGGVMVFNPGDVHNGNPGGRTVLEYAMLYVDPGELLPLVGSAGGPEGSGWRFREVNFRDAVLRAALLRTVRAVVRDSGSTIEQEYGLYAIARRLAQLAGGVWESRGGGRETLLLRAREYINDNIAEDLSVEDLSAVAAMSKFHFIRLFRERFGLTPHRYILNQRVNRARAALEAGRPPSDVAQELAFSDVSHLNRRFKLVYGLTPKQYQTQCAR